METQLRAALIDHLRADPEIASALNIVDEAEIERASPPWLALVASASADWSTKTCAGREVRVALELRLHGDDPATGGETAEKVDARALSLPPGQGGFQVVSAIFLRGRAERREYRFRLIET